jgi:hypothetical protein
MVQFVAPFLPGTATLVDYPGIRFPRSVATVGGAGVPHATGAAGREGGESRVRSRSNVRFCK